MNVGDYVELTEEANYERGGLRMFDGEGELLRMQARVLKVGSNLIRIQREGAIRMKWGSFPMVEWINRNEIHGVVQPGLVPAKGKRYKQFWDG